jgi:hypothetical protein
MIDRGLIVSLIAMLVSVPYMAITTWRRWRAGRYMTVADVVGAALLAIVPIVCIGTAIYAALHTVGFSWERMMDWLDRDITRRKWGGP